MIDCYDVDIAQLEERKIVALEVVGSKPTFHTNFFFARSKIKTNAFIFLWIKMIKKIIFIYFRIKIRRISI